MCLEILGMIVEVSTHSFRARASSICYFCFEQTARDQRADDVADGYIRLAQILPSRAVTFAGNM